MALDHIKLILKALGYPSAEKFDIANKIMFQEVVHSLEDKYIAGWQQEKRNRLDPTDNNRAWNNAFRQYLQDLNCPIPFKASQNEGPVLEWLLHIAIDDDFKNPDLGEEQVPKRAKISQDNSDWDGNGVQDLVSKLESMLQIQSSGSDIAKKLQNIKSAIEDRAHTVDLDSETKGTSGQEILKIHGKTLGFTSGDKIVDSASTLMRILFIKDLRELQSQIDEAIVRVQEYTQNPKANAKLGVVGR